MNKKIKSIAVIAVFLTLIFGFGLLSTVLPDNEISMSERRKLAQLPKATVSSILSGKYFSDAEDYYLDQFAFRDGFRSIKAYFKKYALLQSDNNGVYSLGDDLYKLNFALKENTIEKNIGKLNEIAEKYFGGKGYFCLIPDKNYYQQSEFFPTLDYERLNELIRENSKIELIDIFGSLDASSYYMTDLHWSQNKILDATFVICSALGVSAPVAYKASVLTPFYGAYYGQAALNGNTDSLIYLSNQIINDMKVSDCITGEISTVYHPDKINSIDGYSVFLGGAQPLQRIDNPNCKNGKTLYLFRDSFGSAIAPLIAQDYETVFLIDLRYITLDLVNQYIGFDQNADVLFMYCAQMLNQINL